MAGETRAALSASCGEASPLLWLVLARPTSVSQIVWVLTALPCDNHALQDSSGQSCSGPRAGGSLPGCCPLPRGWAGLSSSPGRSRENRWEEHPGHRSGPGADPARPRPQGVWCSAQPRASRELKGLRVHPDVGGGGRFGPQLCGKALTRCRGGPGQQMGRRGVLADSPWSESALPLLWGHTLSLVPACETLS